LATSKQRHVVHHPGGGWAVAKPHAERVSSRHQTQVQAQTRAREILSHGGGGEAVVHRRDGSIRQSDTVESIAVDWSLLSPQGHVLFYIALCPDSTTKDIARAVGRSERQIWSMIRNLEDGGMLRRRKNQRIHHFTINYEARLLHPTIEELSLRSLMEGAVAQVRRETPDVCEQLHA
jgi:DNA-binding MarR family transcriptional regulator